MRLSRFVSSAASLAITAGLSHAQELHINEIYASHSGTDFDEYIELVGTPNMSLDGWMVVIVEGEFGAAGILDRAWDLTGETMPADGYFLMANVSTAGLDYDLANGPHGGGPSDNIENGSQTYYLLTTNDPSTVESFHNSDIDTDDDLITVLAQFPADIQIREIIGMVDEDGTGDEFYDGTQVLGPDLSGPFYPAGIFRPDDYPNGYCTDEWLDFNGGGLTPGSMNPSSNCTQLDAGDCPDAIYCDTNPDNSADISIDNCSCASGSINISLSNAVAPDGNFGYVLVGQGTTPVTDPPGAQGDLCLIGASIGRFNKGSDIKSITSGSAGPLDVLNAFTAGGGGNIPTIGGNLCAPLGQTWNFQWWYRNGMNPSRFSKAMTVTFN